MKARDVIGRRIVKVRQYRFWNTHTGTFDWDVQSITLDNGTKIWPVTIETEDGEYAHSFGVLKPEKEPHNAL